MPQAHLCMECGWCGLQTESSMVVVAKVHIHKWRTLWECAKEYKDCSTFRRLAVGCRGWLTGPRLCWQTTLIDRQRRLQPLLCIVTVVSVSTVLRSLQLCQTRLERRRPCQWRRTNCPTSGSPAHIATAAWWWRHFTYLDIAVHQIFPQNSHHMSS